MTRTAVRPILVAAPIAWVVALFVAVLVASRPTVGVPAYALSAAVYEIGSLICHQLPNRSFYFWGAQLPVCARCTGLYVGAAVAALVRHPNGPGAATSGVGSCEGALAARCHADGGHVDLRMVQREYAGPLDSRGRRISAGRDRDAHRSRGHHARVGSRDTLEGRARKSR